MTDSPPITELLQRAHAGDDDAMNEVARRVQADFERLARKRIGNRAGASPISLAPEELVNETFVLLLQQRKPFADRQHFFAIATRLMIRALKDHERARARAKRGGPHRVVLSLGALARAGEDPHMTTAHDLDAALTELETAHPRVAYVFSLREFWGLSFDEIGQAVGVARATAARDWRFARAWLRTRLE